MCPHANGDSTPVDRSQMVGVDTSRVGRPTAAINGVNGKTTTQAKAHQHINPYAPRASDFLNNVSNFKIIESTLRGPSQFLSDQRLYA